MDLRGVKYVEGVRWSGGRDLVRIAVEMWTVVVRSLDMVVMVVAGIR